jgi:succinate-acetate transporter protein
MRVLENVVLKWLQTALAIGVFATTLTTLSLSLMEWRGVTTTNVFVANFFFAAAFGLLVTAQWELSIGNGFAYTVFSAFGQRPFLKQKHQLIESRTLLCRVRSYSDAGFWHRCSLR